MCRVGPLALVMGDGGGEDNMPFVKKCSYCFPYCLSDH